MLQMLCSLVLLVGSATAFCPQGIWCGHSEISQRSRAGVAVVQMAQEPPPKEVQKKLESNGGKKAETKAEPEASTILDFGAAIFGAAVDATVWAGTAIAENGVKVLSEPTPPRKSQRRQPSDEAVAPVTTPSQMPMLPSLPVPEPQSPPPTMGNPAFDERLTIIKAYRQKAETALRKTTDMNVKLRAELETLYAQNAGLRQAVRVESLKRSLLPASQARRAALEAQRRATPS